MGDWFYDAFMSFILGAAPISEVRGAALHAFGLGTPYFIVFGIIGNIFAALCLLLFWDLVKIKRIGMMIVGRRIEGMIDRYHKNHEKGEIIALTLFIGMPLPVTGVYSGILVGKILKIDDRKILIASVAGVLLSSAIMFLALSGTLSILSFLVP
ncbi:MAG: small multi-drug export protein [Candidatus Micrarchaeota archaeon]